LLDLMRRDITYKGDPFRAVQLSWNPEEQALKVEFRPTAVAEELMKESADFEVRKTPEPSE